MVKHTQTCWSVFDHFVILALKGLNSIAAQNFVKLLQLEAYNKMHSYDLIRLCETWLDSTNSIDSNDLSLDCYNLHCVDDPRNVKKGRVCVYYKETLAVHFFVRPMYS